MKHIAYQVASVVVGVASIATSAAVSICAYAVAAKMYKGSWVQRMIRRM